MTTEKTDRLSEGKARYKLALEAAEHNLKAWEEDAKFLYLQDQWPEEVKKKRTEQGRPCLVVDKLKQYVQQVVNDGRQNRPAIKVRPVDDSGDVKVAEALQGLIRHVWDRSRGDEALDTALEHAVVGGFGYLRILTEYAREGTLEQEIIIRRVRNPLSVLLDPNAQAADGSDAEYGFVSEDVPRDRFKREWPKAKFTDFEADSAKYKDWMDGETVRVCEYFYKVYETTNVLILEDGTTVKEDEYWAAIEKGGIKIPVKENRQLKTCKVKWCRMTGAEILEENDWLGKHIPIIPVYGNEADVGGKVTYSGLIRPAKDAARLYNYSRSAYAERVALTPKAPWVIAEESIPEEYVGVWDSANTGNHSRLPYRAYNDAGQQLPMPTRAQASDIPEGFARDMQLSEHDIQASMGMYNSSLGERSNETSGKAINARKLEGDVATFHYQDNQSRAVCYLGRQLVDLIPKYWDTRRVARILGEDGKAEMGMVDPSSPAPYMQGPDGVSIYNLNIGSYDVSVTAGPSYTTKRQEAAEAMMQMTQANPQLIQIIGDLMVRNMDWPGADKMADRLKLLLPPQIQQAEQEQQPLPPEIQQAMQQVQQAQQELQQAQMQMQQVAQSLQAEKAATEAEKAKVEAAKKDLDAQGKILQSKYEELSAKLELQAAKLMIPVPGQMPQGPQEPVIKPEEPDEMGAMPPQNPAPPGAFFTS